MTRLKNPGIWALNALLAVGAFFGALALSKVHGSLLPTPLGAHWLLAAPLTALAEMCMFSVRYRSDAQTFSLGEISYVIGAVYLEPKHFFLATALGLVLTYAIRREPLIRSAFNVSATSLVACVIVAFTRLFAGSHPSPSSPGLWVGVIVGCSLAASGQALLVVLVRSIAEHRWLIKEAPQMLLFTQLNGIAISSLGVLIAIVIGVAPVLAFVGMIPLAMIYLFCRQLVREHTMRTNVEFLYETAQSIHNTADIDTAFKGLLERSLTSFHANFGAVLLHRPDTENWMGFTVGETASGLHSIHEQPAWVPPDGVAVSVSRRNADEDVMQLLNQLGANSALVGSLLIEGASQGVLVVADRGGDGADFGELDRRLFELLAQQVAIGVANSQLERSLGVLTRLEGELRHQANHDALTGLANRAMLTSVLQRADNGDRAVLLIDLDDFKTINDSLGHNAGDEVLIEVAHRLRSSVREGDLVARLGGDEFAIVLGVRGESQAATDTAERISAALNRTMTVEGRQIEIHASIGIAAASDGVSLDELLRSADVAMYQAKSAGKGRHMMFESGMDEAARQRMQIISGLRDAIIEKQISLVYQPIVDLTTDATVAVEALLRWEHAQLGTLGPDRFIPLAEESGLIGALGAWALEQACTDIAPLKSVDGRPLDLHVNISALQICTPGFATMVSDTLSATTLSANRLVLEIVENTTFSDSEELPDNVEALRANGVRLALDDFGTGYSSLATAHNFPLDLIKIDQLFVRAMEDGSDSPLVRAILAMADSLGLTPIAEGIETVDQRRALRDLGCKFGQGYLFSPPVKLEDLAANNARVESALSRLA
jgi:diguanylate cyclase (GGDEF)-like protein